MREHKTKWIIQKARKCGRLIHIAQSGIRISQMPFSHTSHNKYRYRRVVGKTVKILPAVQIACLDKMLSSTYQIPGEEAYISKDSVHQD